MPILLLCAISLCPELENQREAHGPGNGRRIPGLRAGVERRRLRRRVGDDRGRHGERRGSSTAKADEDVGSSVGRAIAMGGGGGDKRRAPRASNDKIDLTGATRDESLPRHRSGVTGPQALEARHDLPGAALADAEQFLDRQASADNDVVRSSACCWEKASVVVEALSAITRGRTRRRPLHLSISEGVAAAGAAT